jgi:H+/Cl- antiporter ClcA
MHFQKSTNCQELEGAFLQIISTLPIPEAQELQQQCVGFRSSSTQIMTLLGTSTVPAPMMNSTFCPSLYSLLHRIFLSIFSYSRALSSGVFVPVILTGATYGRWVSMLIGSQSTLDHGLFVVLDSPA